MTREEKLFSMTMACLAEVANKLGIKIDKKGAKSKAVAKILDAEAKQKQKQKQDEGLVPMPGIEKLADVDKEVSRQQAQRALTRKQKKTETHDEHDAEEKTIVANESTTLITSYIISEAEKLGAEVFIPANGMKMRAFKVNGRVFAKIFYTKNSVSMFVRSKSVSHAPDKVINYNLDGQFIFTPGCDLDLISSLLAESYDWVSTKNSNKQTDKTKKEAK